MENNKMSDIFDSLTNLIGSNKKVDYQNPLDEKELSGKQIYLIDYIRKFTLVSTVETATDYISSGKIIIDNKIVTDPMFIIEDPTKIEFGMLL